MIRHASIPPGPRPHTTNTWNHVAFNFNFTEWGVIIAIMNRIDSYSVPQCTIFLSSFNTLLSEHHNIDVYHHDEDNILQYVTAVKFVSVEQLVLIDGEMKSGNYFSTIDCMKDIFRRGGKTKSYPY